VKICSSVCSSGGLLIIVNEVWQNVIMPSSYGLIQTEHDSFILVSQERQGPLFATVTERL
jgi:hypothetical protein